MSHEDFLTLLVSQLQNQNPLDAVSSDKILDQMLSYANYNSQTETAETLSEISATLDSIATALDISV
jgi:flagellar basal-body rod modification protein FlgD